ncbi:MAG: lamin tail domain-containing protein [Balneolaceae bacterium]|nr:lamin tail domain-containing protein [Balneolaceae bacterium]
MENGTPDTDADEFVEILNNNSVDVDISGWTLSDADGVLYTFDENTILKANQAIVVFDDSSVPTGSFGGSLVLISNSDEER